MIHDRSRQFLLPGTTITYHVPFSGDSLLFKLCPSSFTTNPPVAEVVGDELRISKGGPTPIPPNLKNELDNEVGKIKQYVGWVNADVAKFNESLANAARSLAQARRDKILADSRTDRLVWRSAQAPRGGNSHVRDPRCSAKAEPGRVYRQRNRAIQA